MTAEHDDPRGTFAAAHVVESQEEVFAFLASAATHRAEGGVVRIDTHGAVVFLAGAYAYKVKRAVKFPFMDLSTLDRRRQACDAEVRINKVSAPGLYLGTVPIVRRQGALSLGGAGDIVEWVVHMRRFDERQTLDRIADRGELTPALIERLADAIVSSQTIAEAQSGVDFAASLHSIIAGNAASLDELPGLFDTGRVVSLAARSRKALNQVAPLLTARSKGGFVRRCHGDLHLRNIVLLADGPTLFDALEFDETLATTDVLYDLAFVLMDLLDRGLSDEANYLFNRYLVAWHDDCQLRGLAALPLFISVRAAIRAKVVAVSTVHLAAGEQRRTEAEAQRYFALAESALARLPQQVIAIGGFSGSGKSTLAAKLAVDTGRMPGALHLRSDIERKRRWGIAEFDHLPAAAYQPSESCAVYESLRRQTELAIDAGWSVIVDAVHQDPAERDALVRLAGQHGVRFTGLWLDAPMSDLASRISTRIRDASDANGDTVALQAEHGAGAIDWHRIDASAGKAEVLERARQVIRIGS